MRFKGEIEENYTNITNASQIQNDNETLKEISQNWTSKNTY